MSHRETPKGAHTLGGDGEPAQVQKTRFRATFLKDAEGQPGLLIDTGEISFVIQGDDLFNFYAMLKRGLEGGAEKRPAYLG